MPLTITQATAVNRLATYLLSFDEGEQAHADALADLSSLIPDAHKRLAAGYTPERFAAEVNAWDAS